MDGAAQNRDCVLRKSLHAQERDTEENRQLRQAFLETLRAIAPEKLIFLDESGGPHSDSLGC